MMYRRTVIALMVCVFLGSFVSAAAGAGANRLHKLNLLNDVRGLSGEECGVEVDINDRAGLSDAYVTLRGNEAQLVLNRTYVHPATRSFANSQPGCFQSIKAYQINNHMVKVTLAFSPDYQGERNVVLEHTDGVLRVLVDQAAPVSAPVAAAEIPEEEKIDLAALLADSSPKAETNPEEPEQDAVPLVAGASRINWVPAVAKVAMALCVSLAVLFMLVALAKRFRLPARIGGGKQGLIRVVQTSMLDMKRRIAVLDVAGELIVVALTGNDVKMLTKIESETARRRILDGESVEPAATSEPAPEMAEGPIEPEAAVPSFTDRLRAYKRQPPAESEAVQQATLRAITDRIRDLKRL